SPQLTHPNISEHGARMPSFHPATNPHAAKTGPHMYVRSPQSVATSPMVRNASIIRLNLTIYLSLPQTGSIRQADNSVREFGEIVVGHSTCLAAQKCKVSRRQMSLPGAT